MLRLRAADNYLIVRTVFFRLVSFVPRILLNYGGKHTHACTSRPNTISASKRPSRGYCNTLKNAW